MIQNKTATASGEINGKLELPLCETSLSTRTVNTLERERIFTVGDLLECTRGRLRTIPYIHDRTIEEILFAVKQLGFEPKEY